MSQWYSNELSKITHVSVRTLHHYDKIGLLTPSIRLENGYRVYTESDLLRLQQILALKFLGFNLSQIKILLSGAVDMTAQFLMQSQLLEEKAKVLWEASSALKMAAQEPSMPWEKIIKLIDVYHKMQELEKTWVGKVLSKEELREYALFSIEFPSRFSQREKQSFDNEWALLIQETINHLHVDPTSEMGMQLGERCLTLADQFYGKQYVALKTTIWEKGYKTGQVAGSASLEPAVISWLDAAMNAFCRSRVYAILNQIVSENDDTLVPQWHFLLTEMYGECMPLKERVFTLAMQDNTISTVAKNWLKRISQTRTLQ
jgi:DNA-binding transcriptional MerR regulator